MNNSYAPVETGKQVSGSVLLLRLIVIVHVRVSISLKMRNIHCICALIKLFIWSSVFTGIMIMNIIMTINSVSEVVSVAFTFLHSSSLLGLTFTGEKHIICSITALQYYNNSIPIPQSHHYYIHLLLVNRRK